MNIVNMRRILTRGFNLHSKVLGRSQNQYQPITQLRNFSTTLSLNESQDTQQQQHLIVPPTLLETNISGQQLNPFKKIRQQREIIRDLKVPIVSFDHNLGESTLNELEVASKLFKEELRVDLLQRMVIYQRAKRRRGTAKTKTLHEISGTTKKPWPQKGLGRARAGTRRAPQFRGGFKAHGPVQRDFSINLPKKVRKFALRVALSTKYAQNSLTIVENLEIGSHKTKYLNELMAQKGFPEDEKILIAGDDPNEPTSLYYASRNVRRINLLPSAGLNVYDILNHDHLILNIDTIKYLEDKILYY